MNNKQPRLNHIFQLLAGAAFAVAANLTCLGQVAPLPSTQTDETVVNLPEFDVTGTPADRYNAGETSSFARTAGSILDTPMTVNIITPAMIQSLSPNTLFDVADYFAGISPDRNSGIGGVEDRMTFRGFESSLALTDSFTLAFFPQGFELDSNFDPVFMDHAEMIMGPDTIVSPNGAPGGSINAITKSPQFTPSTEISAEIGNFDANRITADSTGPLGTDGHMAYRVIASYQDAALYLPGAMITSAAAVEFTYKFSDTAKFTIKYFGQQEIENGTGHLATSDGEEVYTPNTVGGMTLSDTPQPGFQYDGWNGDATWSTATVRQNITEAELTSALGDHINMRLAGLLEYGQQTTNEAFPDPSINETFNQQSGQVASVTPINPASVPEEAEAQGKEAREIQIQNDYAGTYKIAGVSLDPVVGWAYMNAAIPVWWQAYDKSLPNANLYADYYAPPVPSNSQYTSYSTNNPGETWSLQTYGYMRVGLFNDRLLVTGGASRTWAGENIYTIPYIDEDGVVAGTPGPITDATFSHTYNSLAPSVTPSANTYGRFE